MNTSQNLENLKKNSAPFEKYFPLLGELGIKWSREKYEKMADYTVIRRKLHDAGVFAFNFRRFGSQKYVGYIQSAVSMALEQMRKYTHFSGAGKIFEALITAH